jgi:hypothetical protein
MIWEAFSCRPVKVKNVHQTLSGQKRAGHGGACLSPQLQWETQDRRIMIQANFGKNETLSPN